jgi:hypothetical protein
MLYLWLITLSVGGDVPIDSDTLLITDFVNLKIKLAQSVLSDVLIRVGIRACVHRGGCSYAYEYLYLYCISKKLTKKNKHLGYLWEKNLLTHASCERREEKRARGRVFARKLARRLVCKICDLFML